MSRVSDPSGRGPICLEFWQVRPILAFARDHGADIDRALSRIGLTSGLDATPSDVPLVLTDYFRLQRDIARDLDDLTVRLSERKLTYSTGHFVLSQLKQATTLQDAIRRLAEHFNMLHGDAYNSVRIDGGRITLVIDDSSFPYTLRGDTGLAHFFGDTVLVNVHCLLDSLGHGLAQQALRRVGLVRGRGEPGDGQTQFWTVPVQYGRPAYELVYDFDLACRPIPMPRGLDLSADGIFARVITHLDAMLAQTDVRSMSARTLDLIFEGCTGQAEVATRLGLSLATIDRLAEEGTCFRTLVHRTQFDQARRLLRRGLSPSLVAETLGYSDVRAFNRAFKAWSGQTPAVFARHAPGPAPA